MNKTDDYIGVFDSGVGGISVLRQLLRVMPQERFLYFGDCANAPYGSRSTDEVRRLSLTAADRLLRRGLKALVVACNTATSAAITDLRETYPDLIVVGIEPALKLAADRFPGARIGVMATKVTLREEKFARLMERFSDSNAIYAIPAPGMVELIEAGKAESEEMDALTEALLGPYRNRLNALVLGCTHYPFAQKSIAKALGGNTVLLHGGMGTAMQTRRRLEAAGLLHSGPGEVVFETSGDRERFEKLCRELLYAEEL